MKSHNSQDGFTITELLIGVALFTVASTLMISIFISAVKNQRALQSFMTVNNNAGLVLEQIAREARTGYDFTVGTGIGNCSEGGSEFSFVNGQKQNQTNFSLRENGAITRTEGDMIPQELTASNVEVRRLCFIKKQTETNCVPERITIVMEVAPREFASSTIPLHVQTTVSSRVLPREIVGDPHGCKLP